MITKEDLFKTIANAWWEKSPKIVEFVKKHLSIEGAKIFTRSIPILPLISRAGLGT